MRVWIAAAGPLLILAASTSDADCARTFNQNPAGYVVDANAGLIWSSCPHGQGNRTCRQPLERLTWVDALNLARGSELGGVTNWRIPKIEEIESLSARAGNCLNDFFPGLDAAVVWSSSANLDYATDAWAFDFAAGSRRVEARDSRQILMLVASPE